MLGIRGETSNMVLVRVLFGGTAGVVMAILVAVLLSGAEKDRPGVDEYLPFAWAAAIVLSAIFLIAGFTRRLTVEVGERFALVVGGVSLLASLVPWWATLVGNDTLAGAIYRGLRVPQGIIQFWDLVLPLQSLDCASEGFDVYAPGNGCLSDPTIYGPGLLWLRFEPFGLLSASNSIGLGLLTIIATSLMLGWLARRSVGIGRIVLLLAAVGAPWILLLERGNLDAQVLLGAVIVVLLVSRRESLWTWAAAAAVLWILGTWKYYPFVMGLMLLPVLRIRRGWVVLAAYASAALVYLLAHWSALQVSLAENVQMTDTRDLAGLGRIPLAVRMIGMPFNEAGPTYGHVLVFGLVLVALLWGIFVGRAWNRTPVHPAMLASAGSAIYLVSVLYAGFGFGYKATFLLLCVPILSRLVTNRTGALVPSAICVLLCTAVASIVMWNVVLGTICGLCAAGFALGLAVTVLLRSVAEQRPLRFSINSPTALFRIRPRGESPSLAPMSLGTAANPGTDT